MNIKTLCLGTLSIQECSGYDIKKMFDQAFSHFHSSASYGSIYPALKQLEANGLIKKRVEEGDKHPDKNLFSITEEGKQVLQKELNHAPPTEVFRSDFLVQMFFAHLLDAQRLEQILDEITNTYQTELAYMKSIHNSSCHPRGVDFTLELGIASYEAMLEVIKKQRNSVIKNQFVAPQSALGECHE